MRRDAPGSLHASDRFAWVFVSSVIDLDAVCVSADTFFGSVDVFDQCGAWDLNRPLWEADDVATVTQDA